MDPRKISVLLALVVAASVVPTAMAAGFEISASDTTPIPERTESFQGNSFTFDSMIRADVGESVSVDVTAPGDDETYKVHVRDSDNNVVDSMSGEGSESFTIDLTDYEHGSYAVGVMQDRNYEAVQPMLVSGYDLSVDGPDSTTTDESVDVTVDVTETAASSAPADVMVAVAQGETAHEVEASENDGEYTATIDGDELDEGDYTVYAIAQGDEEAFGRSEVLGISDGHSLSVESGSGDDDSDSNDDGTDSNDDDSDGDESDSTGDSDSSDDSDDSGGAANPPSNETETATETVTETETETATETVTETTTETATETDDGVVTPDERTQTESTGVAGPGFTVAGAVMAVALVALFGRRLA